jgi:hypothetical protein
LGDRMPDSCRGVGWTEVSKVNQRSLLAARIVNAVLQELEDLDFLILPSMRDQRAARLDLEDALYARAERILEEEDL